MSNPDKKRIPEAPAPSTAAGNLLSSVAPPLELPNFITAPSASAAVPQMKPQAVPPPVHPIPLQPQAVESENFGPAIPLSKGEPTLPIRSPEDSQATTQSPMSLGESTPEVEKLGDIMPGSGLLTWVKGAVSTGGILHRVAEKAKSSVDSMITTLDPQMKEYLNSGGDLYLVVASDKDVKISPVREAFQAVFGKATIVGHPVQDVATAPQPVGYGAALAAAKQRVAYVRSSRADLTNNVPVLAIENFLHEAITDRWYDIGLLLLTQPSLGIELQLQTQGTPVPSAAVTALRAATAADSPHAAAGLDLAVGSVMAATLQVPHTQWQEASTGVSRRDLLLLAARSIAGSYRRLLAVSAGES